MEAVVSAVAKLTFALPLALVITAGPAPAATIIITSPQNGATLTKSPPPAVNQVDVKGTWNYTSAHVQYDCGVWKTPPGTAWIPYYTTTTSTRPVNAPWTGYPWGYTNESGTYVWLAITRYQEPNDPRWHHGASYTSTVYVAP